MLNIKHLSKSIQSKKIIDDCSLQINKGETAVLFGASGVGKSTLLRILNNLETIDIGTIELDGIPLDLTTAHQNHIIGLVFQQFNLFEHVTVEQNIMLALENVLHKNKQEALAIAHDLLQHYGLLDKAQSMVSQLSGGQKQRLAIARTLAFKPTIICFDEPTSALDPMLTAQVAKVIEELAAQGYIILVATHDISLIEKMPCTIHLMDKGTIIESVKSVDFMAEKDRYPKISSFIAGNSH